MDRLTVESQLGTRLPPRIVQEILDAHAEAKHAYYLGGLRLAEVEGGRFCEAVFRALEHVTTGTFTPLGQSLNSEALIRTLGAIAASAQPDAIRLHIPRSLRLVYDIRNKRDAAHLADGIDPNLQDSTLVCGILDWVLAELIRLFHAVPANEASRIVDDLVSKAAPLVQDFDGFLKVLDPSLSASDYCLVLLYHRGQQGATFEELSNWAAPSMRTNLRRTLHRMVHDRAHVHDGGDRLFITRAGELEVESRRLLEP